MKDARAIADRQHNDTETALKFADQANRTAQETAAAQIREMAAQSEAMRGQLRQMQADQRPWLFAESVDLPRWNTPRNGGQSPFSTEADIVIKNTGVSTATRGWAYAEIRRFLTETEADHICDIPRNTSSNQIGLPGRTGFAVVPGEALASTKTPRPIMTYLCSHS
jgi:hypothetical protein